MTHSPSSWWEGPNVPRAGFTRFCADQLNVPIPVDEVSDSDGQLIVRRMDLNAAIVALHQARQNGALRRASVERN